METRNVPWVTFVWIVGIVTTILLGVLGFMMKTTNDLSQVKTDVAVVKQDVGWIKNKLGINLSIK